MDVYCKRCGEPYDVDSLSFDFTSQERKDFHAGISCPACKGKEVNARPFVCDLMAAVSDIMGDDIDGLAAAMEDAEYMFGADIFDRELT